MTKIEFQHAYIDAVESVSHASYVAHHAAFETARFLNMLRDSELRDVEHIIIQTGGSWGSAVGYYIGGEYTKPEPFTGWEGVQS